MVPTIQSASSLPVPPQGEEAAFLVVLMQNHKALCGGALVSAFHALTFFLCVLELKKLPLYGGAYILAGTDGMVHGLQKIKYSRETKKTKDYRIAILKVSNTLESRCHGNFLTTLIV